MRSQKKHSEKILVTDSVHSLLLEGLKEKGYTCDYRPAVRLPEVQAIIKDYVGLVVNSKIRVDKEFLDSAEQLKFIARLGSGMEIIDLDEAENRGVKVFRSPEGNCNAVAEHAVGMLLALANNLTKGDREVREKTWKREDNRGFEIMGKTLAVIGYGHTGSAFVQKMTSFGVRILVYDKYKTGFANPAKGIEETDMQTIFDEADILSLHIPYNEETHGLVEGEYIAKFRKPFVLINTSRGAIVNTQDMISALLLGNISGACLDVFENEKPNSFTEDEAAMYWQLYEMDKTVLSPHVAGWTHESKRKMAEFLLKKILTNFCPAVKSLS